ncbi:hypothetical protein [Aeromonas hydrophila]|uniref:hypothetical protein n=1 Tax=Aeromonas hydrophila TaxID=644 RepID=UPI003D1F8586
MVGIDGGEVEMAEVTWNPKKEEREIMFLYDIFADEAGWRGRRNRAVSMPAIDVAAKKLDAFILDVLSDRRERGILIDKLRDMNLKTRDARSEEPSQIKNLMKEIFDCCNLSSEAFDWISPDNQRLCDFVWACLRISHSSRSGMLTYEQALKITDNSDEEEQDRRPVIDLIGTKSNHRDYLYDQLGLPKSSSDSHTKRNCIIRFFDLWDASREKKEKQMEAFSYAWNKIKNKSKMVDWLNKNDDMAGWAWNYTVKTYLSLKIPAWVDLSNSKKDEKEALITLYDLLSVEHRAIWMASLSKSGAQQKYRKNSSDRKAMGIPLSEEHKEMLKKMAKDSNLRIYQVVEEMIEQEYQRRYPSQLE